MQKNGCKRFGWKAKGYSENTPSGSNAPLEKNAGRNAKDNGHPVNMLADLPDAAKVGSSADRPNVFSVRG